MSEKDKILQSTFWKKLRIILRLKMIGALSDMSDCIIANIQSR